MCQLIWSTALQKAQRTGEALSFFCRCQNQHHNRWDLVRYEVERELGMVADRNNDSCVVGVRLCDFPAAPDQVYALGEDVQMSLIGPVVLLRFPIPSVNGRKIRNTYIPFKISTAYEMAQLEQKKQERQAEFDNLLQSLDDEEMKLQAFMAFHNNDVMYVPNKTSRHPHPSNAIMRDKYAGYINYNGEFVSWAQATTRVAPPRTWICQRCLNWFADKVHYAEECPSLQYANWVPMNRRPRPVGIPRSNLRMANKSNLEEVATAPYVDEHGVFWLKK